MFQKPGLWKDTAKALRNIKVFHFRQHQQGVTQQPVIDVHSTQNNNTFHEFNIAEPPSQQPSSLLRPLEHFQLPPFETTQIPLPEQISCLLPWTQDSVVRGSESALSDIAPRYEENEDQIREAQPNSDFGDAPPEYVEMPSTPPLTYKTEDESD